jgi:predicted O-methyltransferase YrrM
MGSSGFELEVGRRLPTVARASRAVGTLRAMISLISEWASRTGLNHPRVLAHEVVDGARAVRRRSDDTAATPQEAFERAGELFPGGPSQDPAEFLPFLKHAAETQPKVVVEIGTESGATHYTLGHGLPTVEVTIAVDLAIRHRVRLHRFRRPGLEVRQVQGSSRAPWVLERVGKLLAERPIDVLFIDGDHTYFGATEDFRLYAPLVRDGGLIAFHDIVPDARLRRGADVFGSGEVPLAWQQLKGRMETREFVGSWEQDGRGIGVVTWDGTRWPFGP